MINSAVKKLPWAECLQSDQRSFEINWFDLAPSTEPFLSTKVMAESREVTVAPISPTLIFSLQGGATLSSSVSTGAKKIGV